jgi:hypothetical protein
VARRKGFCGYRFKVWKEPRFLTEESTQKRMVLKLQSIKNLTKSWHKNKVKISRGRLLELEAEIKAVLLSPFEDQTNQGTESLLRKLELERNKILQQEEDHWRLRSRALWLASGDKNTKYFHNLASHNRAKKFIWDIKGVDGAGVIDQDSLKKEVVYISRTFTKKQIVQILLGNASWSIFSHRWSKRQNPTLYTIWLLWRSCSQCSFILKRKRVEVRWVDNRVLHLFFYLVGEDLLAMVEESRKLGTIMGGINSTFLTLIPKANKPSTFDDYCPISLCNLCYKVISKIIANRIKPFLSREISIEQMGFLEGRRIQDAVGTCS